MISCSELYNPDAYPNAIDFHRWRLNAQQMKIRAEREKVLARKQYFLFYKQQYEQLIERHTGIKVQS